MYNRDYTIRLLQQLVVFLARLAGLKKKDDPEVILIELEAAFSQFSGIPRGLALRMSEEAMLDYFRIGGEFNADRCAVTAILLREEAGIAERLGSPADAETLRKKASFLAERASAFSVLAPELKTLLENGSFSDGP